jgi:hypothetical protein
MKKRWTKIAHVMEDRKFIIWTGGSFGRPRCKWADSFKMDHEGKRLRIHNKTH